jgi:hypothetical protein
MPLQIWSYSGWGSGIESLRIDQQELIAMDETMQNELSAYKSEKVWIQELQNVNASPFHQHPKVIHLVIGNTGEVKIPYTTAGSGHNGLPCGDIATQGVDEIMLQREQIYQVWQGKCPLIAELCQRYSNIGNEKIYDKGSIVRKWSAAFDDEQIAAHR